MENVLASFMNNIKKLKSLATPEAIKFVEQCVQADNYKIYEKINALKQLVVEKEILLGKSAVKKPYAMPNIDTFSSDRDNDVSPKQDRPVTIPVVKVTPKAKSEVAKNPKVANTKVPVAEGPVDIGRLDMRVGRIIEVNRHPDADSLYVEKVDLGNGQIRTVVSGLVKFVPITELENRVGIFMCNLKPAKMRGIESEAMLMCASDPEGNGVEPLIIEGDSIQLGDAVIVSGCEYNPDAQLNPKKKIFEQIKPDLRTNESGIATYKNKVWTLKSSPNSIIKSTKLKNVQIS